MDTPAYLDRLIENQRRSVRWYLMFALLLLSLGLLLLLAGLFLSVPTAPEYFKSVLGIAGAFTTSICAFPLKEVNACKDRLSVFLGLKGGIESAESDDREKIDALIWDVLKKTAGG